MKRTFRKSLLPFIVCVQSIGCSDASDSTRANNGGSSGVEGGAGGSVSGSGGGGTSSGSGGKAGATTNGGGSATSTDFGGASGGAGRSNGGSSSGTGGVGTGAPLPPELTWTRSGPTSIIEEIWGSGTDDIYAIGRSGNLWHSTGNDTWQKQTTGTSSNLTGIWGSGASDIYVSVDANVILHSAGDGQWEHQTYDVGTTFNGIWGNGPDSVFAIGPGLIRRSSSVPWGRPEVVTNGTPVLAIWSSSPTDLYVGTGSGAGSIILHSNGDGTWQRQATPSRTSVVGIWGADANHLFAAAQNEVLFSSGNGTWTTQLTAEGNVNAVWAASNQAVYACSSTGLVYRSNGEGQWSAGQRIHDTALSVSCYAIWGTAPNNLYLGTSNGIYHGVTP